MTNTVRGIYGEKLAAAYLVQRGYQILARNFRVGGGELDIIAHAPQSTLPDGAKDTSLIVFVEVKLRHSDLFGHGDESIGTIKMRRMKIAIDRYIKKIAQEKHMQDFDPDYRIDVIEIEGGVITHTKDIEP